MPIFNLNKIRKHKYIKADVYVLNGEYKVKNFDDDLIWKKHPLYNILVSNKADIISFPNSGHNFYKVICTFKRYDGYKQIRIDNKNKYVHRIVAETFIPNPNNYPEINHIDENKSNNNVNNLEWCTRDYNTSYSISKKIEQIDINTGKVIKIWDSANQAAKFYNGSSLNILNVCKNIYKYNTAYGYFWRFVGSENTIKENKCKKKILQLDINTNNIINTFNSITEAADFMKVSISNISSALTGKSKTSCGYKWAYEYR